MPLNVKAAVPSQAAAIAEIEQMCFPQPWSEAAILTEMEKNAVVLVCQNENGSIIGWGGAEIVLDEASVTNIAVLPSFRRRGAGRAITQALIGFCREKGAATLTLEVRVSNNAAITLYESLGFIRLGLRPRFYESPREDAVMMRLTL